VLSFKIFPSLITRTTRSGLSNSSRSLSGSPSTPMRSASFARRWSRGLVAGGWRRSRQSPRRCALPVDASRHRGADAVRQACSAGHVDCAWRQGRIDRDDRFARRPSSARRLGRGPVRGSQADPPGLCQPSAAPGDTGACAGSGSTRQVTRRRPAAVRLVMPSWPGSTPRRVLRPCGLADAELCPPATVCRTALGRASAETS
jgi:hypothetical protein